MKIYKEIDIGIHDVSPVAVQFVDYSSVEIVTSPYGNGIAIFKNGTGSDLSSTHMPSGSADVSGNILTTPPIVDLVGGNFYIVTIVVGVNGTSQRKHVAIRLNCVNEKSMLMRSK